MSQFTIEDVQQAQELLDYLANKVEAEEPHAVNTIELLREAASHIGMYEEDDL